MDLRGDLEARGQTGHDSEEDTGADGIAEARPSHTGQHEGRQKAAGGGGGDGGRKPATGGSAER